MVYKTYFITFNRIPFFYVFFFLSCHLVFLVSIPAVFVFSNFAIPSDSPIELMGQKKVM